MPAKIKINNKKSTDLKLEVGKFYLIERAQRDELYICAEDSEGDFHLISLEDGAAWCEKESTLSDLLLAAGNYNIRAVDRVRIYVDC